MKVEAIGFSGAVILPAFKKLGELARDIGKFFHQADKLLETLSRLLELKLCCNAPMIG